MAEPLFTAVFGANAVQDINSVTLSKTDLAAVGLTPSASNSAESILTAIIKLAEIPLTETAQETNPDQGVVISDGIPSLPVRNDVTYRRNEKVITFDKIDTASQLDPDDY